MAEANRAHDLPPSEIELWVEDGKKGMENVLRTNSQDVREQYEKQLEGFAGSVRPGDVGATRKKNVWSAPHPQVRSYGERQGGVRKCIRLSNGAFRSPGHDENSRTASLQKLPSSITTAPFSIRLGTCGLIVPRSS